MKKTTEMMSKANVAVNAYDRGILSKKQFSEFVGINLETGELDEELWQEEDEISVSQFLLNILDRRLITDKVALKQIFNLDEEKKED